MNKKKKNSLTIRNSTAEFLIFISQANENVWLTQKLFESDFDREMKKLFKNNENT